MYKITFDKNAKKFLKKLKKGDKKEIIEKIKKLRDNPYLGKRLSGNLFGLWSLRFNKFRVTYKIIENILVIVIVNIKHRKDIYN